MSWKIAVVGCGNVGSAFLELLYDKREYLRGRGFDFQICLVTDAVRGTAIDPDGLSLAELLFSLKGNNSVGGAGIEPFENLLGKSQANILVDATPTDIETGEPGLTHLRVALSRGVHVTTTSKGPMVVAADELESLAKRNGAMLRYEGTVMSGTPLISLIRENLVGCNITSVRGILNGTTNFMLTRMEEGLSYGDALYEAQEKGYAEAKPEGDVEGYDAVAKVAILAWVITGQMLPIANIHRMGITDLRSTEVHAAMRAGECIRLVSSLDMSGSTVKASVKPEFISQRHPLAAVRGVANAITLNTDSLGPITISGPGAGRGETAQALMSDMLHIAKSV